MVRAMENRKQVTEVTYVHAEQDIKADLPIEKQCSINIILPPYFLLTSIGISL